MSDQLEEAPEELIFLSRDAVLLVRAGDAKEVSPRRAAEDPEPVLGLGSRLGCDA